MPSNPKPARAPLRPGADFDQRAIPVTRQPQRIWFRVHKAGSPAILFGKLPHHRFSHPDCPFPLLYLGATIQTCLWEYFGDDVFQGKRAISAGKWGGCCLSQIVVPELKVCAISLERTRDAMSVDKASLLAADLTIPQAWGLAVQRHPAGFEAIKHSSRFLDQPCLTLFDRGGLQAKLRAKALGALSTVDAAVDWLDERRAPLV
jgi:RES domain